MIANRPDWTLSRQRQWGVPMPFFIRKETGELHPRTLELLEEVAKRVEQGGIEAWQSIDARIAARRRGAPLREGQGHARRLVRLGLDALHGAARLARGRERVSGGPLPRRLGPAPRLVPFVAARLVHDRRHPALRALLTHGFVVDGEGRKMTKSKGNVIAPQQVMDDARRRHPAPVGRVHRLLGRALDLERDPEARRGDLPAHPQHAALPAREPRRLRSRARRAAGGRDGSRSTATRCAHDARALQETAVARHYGALRVPSRRAEAADVLLRRPRRLLPRHPQGPALHRRPTRSRAARRRTRSITSRRA